MDSDSNVEDGRSKKLKVSFVVYILLEFIFYPGFFFFFFFFFIIISG